MQSDLVNMYSKPYEIISHTAEILQLIQNILYLLIIEACLLVILSLVYTFLVFVEQGTYLLLIEEKLEIFAKGKELFID